MTLFRYVFAAAIAFMPLSAANAQSQAGDIAQQVFSEVEKRIIREHYGQNAQPTVDDTSAPKWAVKDNGDRGDDDHENDSDRDKPKKDKEDREKGKGKDKGKDKSKGKSGDMPPGLAKREQLPPGLAKQLRDKGRLPPGIAKRNLPDDLAAKLPARPDDQEVTVVEGDVVLADKATGIILDVIKDVITNGASSNSGGTLAPPSNQNGQNNPAEPSILDSVLKSIFGNGN